MIEIRSVSKSFGPIRAVRDVTLYIKEKTIFGLVGTNGAGKSTLLRMMSGVLRADRGIIRIDQENIYDNPLAKVKIFFVSDDFYFLPNSTGEEMALYYRGLYPNFDMSFFCRLMESFSLGKNRKISTLSKGMKKQLALILGLAAKSPYLFCDEAFDGLDPAARQLAKSIFAAEMEERGLAVVISSHNLRELEDVSDQIGILHEGGILLAENLEFLRQKRQKIQLVFASEEDRKRFESGVKVLLARRQGHMMVYTIEGTKEALEETLSKCRTIYVERLYLSLEELFISEMEVVGYDVGKFIQA